MIWGIIVRVIQIAWSIISIPLRLMWGIFAGFIKSIFPEVRDVWTWLWNGVASVFQTVWGILKPIFTAIQDFLTWIIESLQWLADAAEGFGRAIGSAFAGVAETIGGAVGGAAEFIGGVAGGVGEFLGFQHGGIVPGRFGTPVPIIAHAGERIVPTGATNMGGVTIINNIEASISSDVDIDAMTDRISNNIAEKMRGMTR